MYARAPARDSLLPALLRVALPLPLPLLRLLPLAGRETSQREAGEDLADDPLGDERGDVGRADRGRDHLDDLRPDDIEPRGKLATRAEEIGARHSARLGCARARSERGIEHVDVDRQERRAAAHRGDGALHDGLEAELVHVVHEEARDPALALPRELALAGPVAAEADLHVPARVYDSVLDQPVHRRAVR